ncbi:MAG: Hsp20/alpha crystallin family protein [Desulfobacterales bacterium]|nr:Hsp20/alpha crystallin family protein [Desulfobacterales bacterium]MBF0398031.1 Hsp20/alpha crystallin family protein [Desulfobacterales bacterium]
MTTLFPVLRAANFLTRPAYNIFDLFLEDFETKEKWEPKIDIAETEKEITVKAELPGVDKENIHVALTDGLLTIKGEKKHEKEDKKENYHLIERHYGTFTRTLRVPQEVEVEKIDAAYKDGVLKLTLPKGETVKTKKIEIKS